MPRLYLHGDVPALYVLVNVVPTFYVFSKAKDAAVG
jgi:hypothetical protein